MRTPETALYALLALLAFASNSILTRLALGGGSGQMDAATFTTVRLLAGAVVLAVLVGLQDRSWSRLRGRLRGGGALGPLSLFVYAAPFSFAYVRIGAAAGALLLFGSVQLTMVGWAIVAGERPRPRTWLGLAVAAAGLAWLTLPSVGRPDPAGSALMVVAGCAWGAYSLAGRTAPDALVSNARSFLLVAPPMLALEALAAASARVHVSSRGVALAIVCGGITSGLGYAIWYRALRGLTAIQAAILQLAVPVIAALGAVVVLHERLGPRLVVAGVAVLTGLGLALWSRLRP